MGCLKKSLGPNNPSRLDNHSSYIHEHHHFPNPNSLLLPPSLPLLPTTAASLPLLGALLLTHHKMHIGVQPHRPPRDPVVAALQAHRRPRDPARWLSTRSNGGGVQAYLDTVWWRCEGLHCVVEAAMVIACPGFAWTFGLSRASRRCTSPTDPVSRCCLTRYASPTDLAPIDDASARMRQRRQRRLGSTADGGGSALDGLYWLI